jgi:hypothetical protein
LFCAIEEIEKNIQKNTGMADFKNGKETVH